MATGVREFSAQLQGLKEKLGTFVESVSPTFADVRNEASIPANKLFNYVELATRYLPHISVLLERLLSRSNQDAVAALPVEHAAKRRRGHRVLIAGIAVGAGIVAYGLYSGRFTALARRYAAKA